MTDTTNTNGYLRIASINVQGAREYGFFKAVARWGVDIGNFDIIACQETKLQADKTTKYLLFDKNERSQYTGFWANAKTREMGAGVAFLVKESWQKHIIRRNTHNGRGISLDFGYHLGAHFRIVNCYVPASRDEERKRELQELTEWAKKEIQEAKEKGMETIVCGDFNGVMNPSLDRSNEKKQNTNIENGLLEWLVENQFTDSFRELHPETRAYSFRDISRLDMIWLAGGLKGGMTEAGMMPLEGGIHSDYKGFFAELDVRTLVTPTPLHILEQYSSLEHKVKVDEASEEQWESYSIQLEQDLIAKMTHGSTGINIMETDTSNPREAPILAENMIDFAWDNLAEAIMGVALETLPRKRVGKQSMAYRTNVQNDRRGRCHGELLRLSHVWFVNPNCPPQGKERRQMAAHETICNVWNKVKTDFPETRIAEPPELQAERNEWEQWRNTVKNEWSEQQRIRRNEERKQKTKDIAEAIERRDMRFSTNTKSTIQSILETNRSHATLDRVQITVDDRISISDHPFDILTNVRLYFEKWHGPRQSKGIPKVLFGSRYTSQLNTSKQDGMTTC